jgi:peptidoglycan/LPS O-acetylase OafA/YrhL
MIPEQHIFPLPKLNPVTVLKEIFVCGLFFGHAHFSLLLPGSLGDRLGLPALSHSFNPPLWSLHLEFYGSLIVLGLVAARERLTRRWHKVLCAVCTLGLIAHPMGLFVIGYLVAQMIRTVWWRRFVEGWLVRKLAVLAIILGVAMSAHVAPGWLIGAYDKVSRFEVLPMRADEFHFYAQYGAMLIFFGVLVLPELQGFLAGRLGRVLGRYSFSLYLVHFPVSVDRHGHVGGVVRQFGGVGHGCSGGGWAGGNSGHYGII